MQSPQGDGNLEEKLMMDTEKIIIWEMQSPQGDGNNKTKLPDIQGVGIWEMQSPQGDGNTVFFMFRII